jgi:hypothetical protein
MDDRASGAKRFTLLDAMILVAATAIGIAVFRTAIPDFRNPGDWTSGASAFLVSWSSAALLLRVRPPRPHVRRWVTRPGDAASMATILGTILTGLLCLLQSVGSLLTGSNKGPLLPFALVVFSIVIAPAVATSWLMIALGRRWRREVDGIGWLGRVLGVGWMILFVLMGLLI